MLAMRLWTTANAMKSCVIIIIVAAGCSLPRPLLGGMLNIHEGMLWELPPVTTDTNNDKQIQSNENTNQTMDPILYCFEDLPSSFIRIYNPIRIAFFYAMPLVVIAFIYVRISYVLNRTDMVPGEHSAEHKAVRRKRVAKMTRMLVAMVIVFGICWLPYQGFLMVQVSIECPSKSRTYNA